jgi:EAL domain-containing protein (putative c-di-GMP-specific phosphodiesterase class I)
MKSARKAMEQLRECGFKMGLANFGTGPSSLSLLKDSFLNFLKVERSLIQGMENGNGAKLLEGIIDLAHALSLRVVVDGVNTWQQLARLRELGCDDAQGAFICPQVKAENLVAELENIPRMSHCEGDAHVGNIRASGG